MKRVLLFLWVMTFWSCSEDDDSSTDTMNEVTFLGEVDWIKTYGGSGEDTAQSVIQTSDGGYAILGYSNSIDGDLASKTMEVNDYWLLKLDVDGTLQWSKTYGGSKDDKGQSVIQTTDGGYAIVGYAMSDDGDGSNNEGFHDNWILRLDASGNILWEKSFGFAGHDHSYDVIQTDDGGFFFAGFLDVTLSNGEGNFGKGTSLTAHGVGEFWGTRLNANGNLQWRRYFGGTNNDRAHGVVQADDGGFVMAGFSESDDFDISNTKGSYDFWVVKVDGKGNMLWEKSFGGTGIEISYDIVKTQDGDYAIVGNTFSTDADVSRNNGESDVWLIKIDDKGNLLWEKTFGGIGFDAARGLSTTSDGGFVLAGNSKSSDGDASGNHGENDLWVIKTDASGKLVYQQSFGGSGLDFGFDVIEDSDGALVLVGEAASDDFLELEHKGLTDLVVIKIK
ncbi:MULTISPECIES: hypothetical protein [Flavobacteriaceae]|uniref:hypothetical protein n=1 Tax=Flavobacteriaceae TaxID=49546 RepID=UPI001491C491|nr:MULTISPECIES: hypothetical protein [Allomuricauda]MDC6366394.1 hypothetical protein [Muricauda sp. AC10]